MLWQTRDLGSSGDLHRSFMYLFVWQHIDNTDYIRYCQGIQAWECGSKPGMGRFQEYSFLHKSAIASYLRFIWVELSRFAVAYRTHLP